MFLHYRSKGLVLKKIDRGEADQLFVMFTEDFGKVEVLGKAIRKITSKLRGSIDIFSLCEIEFIQGKAQKTLTDAVLIYRFGDLGRNFKKLKATHRIAEVLDDLVRGQEPDEQIWRLLLEVFKKIEDNDAKLASLAYHYFLWNFLLLMGFGPELHSCSVCQKKIEPGNIYFDIGKGGLVCLECQKEKKEEELVDMDIIKILRLILARDWVILEKIKIEAKNLKSLKKISDYYISEVSNILLK